MFEKRDFWLGLLIGCVIASVFLVIGVFSWPSIEGTLPAYQRVNSGPPNSTPDTLDEVKQKVAELEDAQAYTLREVTWKIDQKLVFMGWTALFISFVAAFIGLKTYSDLDKVIREKVKTTLDRELYQLDPTNLPIWVIAPDEEQKLFDIKEKKETTVHVGKEMERIIERLKLSGLQVVHVREALDKKSYRGVTIVPVFNGDMEKQFAAFLERNKPLLDKERAAFVLYTQTHLVDKDVLLAYPNLATANMPATTASMILTVGRGLKNEPPEKEQK